MHPGFKPLLAEPVEDITKLCYPLLASVKYDGIRCVIVNGVALSRSLKPIPNRFVQACLGDPRFNGLDGELMVEGGFQDVTSAFMSADGEPDFYYAVFDSFVEPARAFTQRNHAVGSYPAHPRIRHVRQHSVRTPADLTALYESFLADGHEGAMVRSPDGPYKFGRSTLREGTLLKWKPMEDAEAIVVGFEERMHNANEATTNALGRTERSSHKAGLVPMGTLGALIAKNDKLWPGLTFNLGTGFTDADRAYIWANRAAFLGHPAKFKYQAVGTKDKPRIPVFLGWRAAEDMS